MREYDILLIAIVFLLSRIVDRLRAIHKELMKP